MDQHNPLHVIDGDIEQSKVFRVTTDNIVKLWPQIVALLDIEPVHFLTHDNDHVRNALLSSSAHLWMQWNLHTVEAIVVTQFENFPKGLFLRAWIACALPSVKMLHDTFYDKITKWAAYYGCIAVLATGRFGWMRKYPNVQSDGTLMRITL